MNTIPCSLDSAFQAAGAPVAAGIPSDRFCFRLDPAAMTVPRLGVGAYAIVLDALDRKSGGEVAVKFVQVHRGAATPAEVETRERFFDQEITKIKSLANDPFLLEYLDDALLGCDRLVLLRPAPGANAYHLQLLDPADAGEEVAASLLALNDHLASRRCDLGNDEAWMDEVYRWRAQLRQAVARSAAPQLRAGQLLNGQRFLITKKYQTTLTRLLVQQPNLPNEERLELLLELLKALKQIHTMDITHGDLCPDNIMFKLSLLGDRDLIHEMREQGIPTRYLFEMQSVLIDLGRVVKGDMRGRGQLTVGLPVLEGNNRLSYAPMEMVLLSERLPFERYTITLQGERLVLEPLWEFETLTSNDVLLGELTRPAEGRGNTATEGMSRGRRLGQLFTKGDILYNSSWGFVVEETGEETVTLLADEVYRFDHANRLLTRVPKEEFLSTSLDGGRWEFDDILHANYQHGIPADIFAMGMTIVETLVGHQLPPGALREFADRCRTIVVGKRTPAELANDTDLGVVAAAFAQHDLRDFFVLVLKCVVRGDPALGYYCRNHADNRKLATLLLLRDFSELTQRYRAVSLDDKVNSRIHELTEQLERYRQTLGSDVDRSQMYQDMAATKSRLAEMEKKNVRQLEEIEALKMRVGALTNALDDEKRALESLRGDKAALEEQLVAARNQVRDLDGRLRSAEETARQRGEEIAALRAEGDQARVREQALRAELDAARAKVAELEGKLAGVERELAAAKQRVETLEPEAARARQLAEQLEAQCRYGGELESKLAGLEARAANQESKIARMRELLDAFTRKHGPDYRKSVKGWFSRKPAAEMLNEFRGMLLNDGDGSEPVGKQEDASAA